MASTLLGVALAALSAVFNGSFGALSKADRVKQQNVTPLHFNFFVAEGLVLSSLPLLLFYRQLTPYGLASGVLFVLSTGCTFLAIDQLGISIASAIWSGTAMLASFIWGIRISGDELSAPGWAIPALLLLVGGLAGIALSGRYSEAIRQHQADVDAENGHLEQLSRRMSEERIMDPMHEEVDHLGPQGYFVGISAAVLAGIFGGLILAPKTFSSDVKGLAYLPSMGLGVLLAAPLLTAVVSYLNSRSFRLPSQRSMQVAALYGIVAGVIWNLGNIFSILATERIGIAIAYPIFQCGLLVAGLWGILLFDEVAKQCIPGYLLSGMALILGAAFLALAK